MPGTHVALLRGINVGTAKRIAMADLRDVVAGLGYGDVRTLLNSGNVVFAATGGAKGDPGPRIERAIARELGVSSRVTILTAREFGAIMKANPLAGPTRDDRRLMAAVLADANDRALIAPLAGQDWGDDALALGPRVAYVWCAGGTIESELFTKLARLLKDGVTSRNWATMKKLAAMLA